MTTSSLPKRAFCALSILLALGLGCARDSSGAKETTSEAAKGARLDLGVRLSDGRWLELADLRGTPVLLFVFATFDAVSQAALKSLRPFIPQHPEVVVIGVAAQPRAEQLVEAWAHALDPPFVVGADPYGSVENGESTLGKDRNRADLHPVQRQRLRNGPHDRVGHRGGLGPPSGTVVPPGAVARRTRRYPVLSTARRDPDRGDRPPAGELHPRNYNARHPERPARRRADRHCE